MLTKVHSTSGLSFKGVMNYLLGAGREYQGDDRVAWTHTHNLGTQNPAVAARVMAATAMNQAELKRDAGIKNSGNKPKGGAVMHYTLSWKEGEVEGLTPEQMKRAALETLAVLGSDGKPRKGKATREQRAIEHQAVIVAHREKSHQHVHIIVNRVHPQHGVLLPTGNDWKKLSKWALQFEQRNGNVVCPRRQVNQDARKLRRYVKAERDVPRIAFEAMRSASNDNRQRAEAVYQEQRSRTRTIAQEERSQRVRQVRRRLALESEYRNHKQQIAKLRADRLRQDTKEIVALYIGRRCEQFGARQQELRALEKRAQSPLGRVLNRFEALDLFAVTGSRKEKLSAGRTYRLSELFKSLNDPVVQRQAVIDKYDRAKAKLDRAEQHEIRRASQRRSAEQRRELAAARSKYLQERGALELTRRGEGAKVRAQWQQYREHFAAQWKALRHQSSPEPHRRQEALRDLAAGLRQDRSTGEKAPVREQGQDGQER